jgi:hypothetical protein
VLADGRRAWPWAERWFGDCLYSTSDHVSFALGLVSMAIWMVASVPQIVDNYRNGSAQAQSVWFWVLLLTGDLLNFVRSLPVSCTPLHTRIASSPVPLLLFAHASCFLRADSLPSVRTSGASSVVCWAISCRHRQVWRLSTCW